MGNNILLNLPFLWFDDPNKHLKRSKTNYKGLINDEYGILYKLDLIEFI